MTTCLMVAAAVLGQANGTVDSIRIRNDANQPWNLWMYVDARKAWARPELFLPKKTTVKVNLAAPGRYYLVLRDDGKRDAHYGWVDLHQISRRLPADAVVGLTTVLETRVKEETYTVMVPVQKTETVREIVNGKVVTREVVRTVNVPEQRTRTVNHTVVVPQFDVYSNGRSRPLSDFIPR